MLGKNPPDDILINRGPERQIDLVGDVRTSPGRIALFPFDNRTDQICRRTFRTRLGFSALVKIGTGIFASPTRDENSTTWMA
jgi:hypothetical protein